MYKKTIFLLFISILSCYQIKNDPPTKFNEIFTNLNGTWQLNHDKTIETLLRLNSPDNLNEPDLYKNILLTFKNDVPEIIFIFSKNKEDINIQEWEIKYSIKKDNKLNQINKKGIISISQTKNKAPRQIIFLELIEKNENNNNPSSREIISIEFINPDEIKISLQLNHNEKFFNEIYFKKIN